MLEMTNIWTDTVVAFRRRQNLRCSDQLLRSLNAAFLWPPILATLFSTQPAVRAPRHMWPNNGGAAGSPSTPHALRLRLPAPASWALAILITCLPTAATGNSRKPKSLERASDAPTHGNIRQGFVYERVPHITLKSIANNAEIDVIWDKFQEKLEPFAQAAQ